MSSQLERCRPTENAYSRKREVKRCGILAGESVGDRVQFERPFGEYPRRIRVLT